MNATPEIHAVLLAAGLSTRMAPRNKLLIADAAGMPMVARAATAACASRVAEVTVVTGHQSDAVQAAITHAVASPKLRFVTAPDYANGLSASLRAGIAALPARAAAALICLGDMPDVSASLLDMIVGRYDPAQGRLIVVPIHGGTQGNPVVWDRRFFADILALSGDAGAKQLLARHAAHAAMIDLDSDAVLRDFDAPDMLAR
jgi:molybdenum cofactor cytidylyltransferase